MNKEIENLNNIYTNSKSNSKYPKQLFKYRSFDNYAFDMLENNYVYLCPAENLDDETECVSTTSIQKIYDPETKVIKKECMLEILNIFRPYTTKENYTKIETKIMSFADKNGDFNYASFLTNISKSIKEIVPSANLAPLNNLDLQLDKLLLEEQNDLTPKIKTVLRKTINSRKEIGICSLCISPKIEDMWERYANNFKGYCIEYDMSQFNKTNRLFPVIYVEKKETNIILLFVKTILCQVIFQLSKGKINTDRSQFVRLFLTKYKEWEYQKEWRIIGEANTKITAPKINAIYIGKNASIENSQKIISYCNKNNTKVIQL